MPRKPADPDLPPVGGDKGGTLGAREEREPWPERLKPLGKSVESLLDDDAAIQRRALAQLLSLMEMPIYVQPKGRGSAREISVGLARIKADIAMHLRGLLPVNDDLLRSLNDAHQLGAGEGRSKEAGRANGLRHTG